MRQSASLIALVFAVACRAVEPVAMPTVSATIAHAEVPVGQTVFLDVTLTNDTSFPIDVQVPIAVLEVRDATGRIVADGRLPGTGYRTMGKPLDKRIAPGTTLTDRLSWAGELTGTSSRATAGTYFLRAGVPVRGEMNTYIYSLPVTVVLTP